MSVVSGASSETYGSMTSKSIRFAEEMGIRKEDIKHYMSVIEESTDMGGEDFLKTAAHQLTNVIAIKDLVCYENDEEFEHFGDVTTKCFQKIASRLSSLATTAVDTQSDMIMEPSFDEGIGDMKKLMGTIFKINDYLIKECIPKTHHKKLLDNAVFEKGKTKTLYNVTRFKTKEIPIGVLKQISSRSCCRFYYSKMKEFCLRADKWDTEMKKIEKRMKTERRFSQLGKSEKRSHRIRLLTRYAERAQKYVWIFAAASFVARTVVKGIYFSKGSFWLVVAQSVCLFFFGYTTVGWDFFGAVIKAVVKFVAAVFISQVPLAMVTLKRIISFFSAIGIEIHKGDVRGFRKFLRGGVGLTVIGVKMIVHYIIHRYLTQMGRIICQIAGNMGVSLELLMTEVSKFKEGMIKEFGERSHAILKFMQSISLSAMSWVQNGFTNITLALMEDMKTKWDTLSGQIKDLNFFNFMRGIKTFFGSFFVGDREGGGGSSEPSTMLVQRVTSIAGDFTKEKGVAPIPKEDLRRMVVMVKELGLDPELKTTAALVRMRVAGEIAFSSDTAAKLSEEIMKEGKVQLEEGAQEIADHLKKSSKRISESLLKPGELGEENARNVLGGINSGKILKNLLIGAAVFAPILVEISQWSSMYLT